MHKNAPRSDYTSERRLPSILAGAFTLALVFALGVAGFYAFFFSDRTLSLDPEQWGQFGDFVGGVINPFVGLITVFLVVLSISIQRRELAATVDEMKSANQGAARMSFEQSLFSWLSNYHSLIEAVRYNELHGREALDQMYGDNFRVPLPPFLKPPYTSESIDREEIETVLSTALDSYNQVFEAHRSILDAPLRTLFRLFQWIDEQDLDAESKWHYAALVRAQLSWAELVHLFFNGLTPRGHKFALICNKYAILDNLLIGRDELIDASALQMAIGEDDPSEALSMNLSLTSAAFSSDHAKALLGFGARFVPQAAT
jgi:hypothetical protein